MVFVMGADLNQITVNGQTLTSGGDGRGVALLNVGGFIIGYRVVNASANRKVVLVVRLT